MKWNKLLNKDAFAPRPYTPEHDLQEFAEALKGALATALHSVTVFGSWASGEFKPAHSDVNVMVVVQDIPHAAAQPLEDVLLRWVRKGHGKPIILKHSQIAEMAKALPIEFLDILDYHRQYYGPDPFAGLTPDRSQLRYQCRHELAVIRIKLLQGYAASGLEPGRLRELMQESLPSVLTLFRSVLRLSENVPALNKLQAAERLAARLNLDIELLKRLQEGQVVRHSDNLVEAYARYTHMIDVVAAALEKE